MPRGDRDPAPAVAGTMTRSQLLLERGYSAEEIAGKGSRNGAHAAEEAPPANLPMDPSAESPESPADDGPGMNGPADDLDVRRCQQCAGPLEATARPQTRFCSKQCANRWHETQRQAVVIEARRARARAGESGELGRLVAAVFDAGAVLEVELAGGLRLTARR